MSEGWFPGKYLGSKAPSPTPSSKSNKSGAVDEAHSSGRLDAFMGKFSSGQREDLSELHGCMWEHDENVANCRHCGVEFGMMTRKHHCRGKNNQTPQITSRSFTYACYWLHRLRWHIL